MAKPVTAEFSVSDLREFLEFVKAAYLYDNRLRVNGRDVILATYEFRPTPGEEGVSSDGRSLVISVGGGHHEFTMGVRA